MLAFDKNTGAPLWATQLDTHYAALFTQSATFRGSMLALDVETGAILWKTYMVPPGYTGGAVWGSAPAVDVIRGQVCIATDNYFDSVLALDLKTGVVHRSARLHRQTQRCCGRRPKERQVLGA